MHYTTTLHEGIKQGAIVVHIGQDIFRVKKDDWEMVITKRVFNNWISKKWLCDEYEHKKKTLSIERIKKVVCQESDIKENVVFRRTRIRPVVQARQIIQSIASKHLRLSLSDVGKMTGGYGHCTTLHSIKTVPNLYSSNKDYRNILNRINKRLGI